MFLPCLYLICFLQLGGRGSSTWFFLVPLAICPLWNIISLPGLGCFHLVPFSPPLLDSLFYWWLVGFHHFWILSHEVIVILDMQPIKNFYSILCHAIMHMLISSFKPKNMEPLLLFFQVFCLESKDIVNLEEK